MPNDVIVGYDGSDRSRDALAFAAQLAASEDGRIVVACVYPPAPRSAAVAEPGKGAQVRVEALQTAETGRALLKRPEEAESVAVLSSTAAAGLADLAGERAAAAVVLGSSHRGRLGRIVPGSVASRLLAGGPSAIAIAPAGYANEADKPLHTIGAALDASAESKRALHVAERLAARAGGRLHIVVVAKPGANDVERVSRLLDEAAAEAPVSVHASGELRRGDPAGELVRASEDFDLLVCGSRGHGPLRQVLLGSVSSRVVSEAGCPVLVIPRGEDGTGTASAAPATTPAAATG